MFEWGKVSITIGATNGFVSLVTLHCRLCPEHCGSNINIVTQRGCSDHYSSHAQWCPHRTPCNRGQMFHTGYHAYLFRLLPSLPALSSQMFVLLNITETWFLVVIIVNSVSKMSFSPLFSHVKSFSFYCVCTHFSKELLNFIMLSLSLHRRQQSPKNVWASAVSPWWRHRQWF